VLQETFFRFFLAKMQGERITDEPAGFSDPRLEKIVQRAGVGFT
jgi:hypothetical protein